MLGKKYSLNLIFVSNEYSEQLNKEFRKKPNPTNILTFTLDDNSGEIYINPYIAEKEAEENGVSFKNHLIFLYIHGILHLRGYEHGNDMEKEEDKYTSKFIY